MKCCGRGREYSRIVAKPGRATAKTISRSDDDCRDDLFLAEPVEVAPPRRRLAGRGGCHGSHVAVLLWQGRSASSMNGGVHDLVLGRGRSIEFGDDAAEAGHQDAIRNGEDLRQIRGDHHDGLAFVGEAADLRVDFGNGADVDAAGRLVEDDDRRILRQRFGDDDLLLVAAGKLDDARLALERGDLQPLDPIIRQLAALERATAGSSSRPWSRAC